MSRILLVRHGQASFGAADYDDLSPTGHEQSRVLGAALAARGVVPDLLVAGEMRRHGQTAAGVLDGAGWTTDVEVDAGWNEFDHLQVLAVHDQPTTAEGESEKAAFQRVVRGGDAALDVGRARRVVRRVLHRLHRHASVLRSRGSRRRCPAAGPPSC